MKDNRILKVYGILTAFIVVIFGLIFGLSLLLKPVKNSNIMKNDIKKYSAIISGVTKLDNLEIDKAHDLILDKKLAKNDADKVLATLYTAKDFNSYGSITIIVAVDETGLIKGIDVTELDQSLHQDSVAAYIKGLKNSNVTAPLSGVTGATVSSGSVEKMLEQIAKSQNIQNEVDIYEELFGEGYVLTDQGITAVKSVKKHSVVKVDDVVKGHVYNSLLEGEFNDGNSDVIEIDFILNVDNKLIGYEIVNYKHTGGSYRKKVIAYLDELVADNVDVVNIEEKLHDVTGATNSGKVVNEMLRDLSSVVGGK